jgi:hypothetical protein
VGLTLALTDFFKRMRVGRRRNEPQRDTLPFPNWLLNPTTRNDRRPAFKPTPRNLRYFARTPYARAAINAIKNPIAMLEWEVGPIRGVDLTPELERQIEVAKRCLDAPNNDDSFRTLAEQVLEDILHGAGAIEMQLSGDAIRPLWLYPTDGLSIQIYPAWSGDRNEARYAQSTGYGAYQGVGDTIQLRNDELIYIRPNPTTASPFGLGPLEVAFTSISRQLGVGEFAGNVATNARPGIMLDMGEGAATEVVAAFRAYWTNEIEGQGKVPIVSTKGGKVERLYPDGDTALYLEYQEFLKTEIAVAFGLSPMNLGVERDVNRNTAETSAHRDQAGAIVPMAKLLTSHLTRDAIQGLLGFSQLEVRFPELDAEDEGDLSETYARDYQNNAVTANEYRARRGLPKLKSPFGDLLKCEADIAIAAAKGAAEVLDPNLTPTGAAKPTPKPKEP